MDRVQALQLANPGLQILPATDATFARYGRLIQNLDASREMAVARDLILMGNDVVYEASVPALESCQHLLKELETIHYGGMPVELGWCYGHNLRLNGLEYHKGSEIDVAVTDCVLMLTHFDDIHWGAEPWIDSSTVKSFFMPSGAVFELYAWCLHFAPLHISEHIGFCILVGLPHGTNTPLEDQPIRSGESVLLFARNKWLFAHPEAEGLIRDGAYVGIRGKNLQLKPIL